MHALPTSKLIFIFFFSVAFLHGMSEANKQYASKGRKEAPPFLEIADGQVPSQAQRVTNDVSAAPLDNPQSKKPLQMHLENNETAEIPAAQSSSDRKMPYFLIFNIPRLTPDQDPDYGWSVWTDWTPCSTKCGVRSRQFRIRHCELSPADANACAGEDTQWKSCDVAPCAGPGEQDRGEAEEAAKEKAEWKRPNSDAVGPTGIDPAQGGGDAHPSEKKEEEEIVSWHRCASPCPFEIYLRQRWCFVGMYCVGDHREARVCTNRFGLLFCSKVDLAGLDPTFDTDSDGQVSDSPSARPWTDTRIGWSLWTPWAICSDDCLYHVQELNASRPCPENDAGGGKTTDCVDGNSKDLRICREGGGGGGGSEVESAESSIICVSIEKLSNWKVAEDYKSRKAFAAYNGRVVHGIIVLLLFGPLVILIFYWLVTRSRRPRYESLPSAATNSLYANAQSSLSTDASSAVGPNHVVVVEDNTKNWKTA